jgi:hypothetical protein
MPWFGPTTTHPKDLEKFDDLFSSNFEVEEESDKEDER